MLLKSTASSNPAHRSGGGQYVDIGSTTTLSNCTVSGNSAVAGGGVANQGTLSVASCTINNNTATSAGGGISTTGVGSTATITNSVINSNQFNSSRTAIAGGTA